jgi:hypothetical protein
MPVFKVLSITEHRQKTPLTLLDFKEPSIGSTELLIKNVAVAQVRMNINARLKDADCTE